MDEKLYRETFSRLRASDEAKKEVLLKMSDARKTRRPLKVLRTAAIAAALTLALAVTANAASGGELLGQIIELTVVWSDGYGFHDVMVDGQGNEWNAYDVSAKTELRDGRLIVKALGQEADVTEDLEADGTASHTFRYEDMDLTVTVTGTLEEHTVSTLSDSLPVWSEGDAEGAEGSREISGEDRQETYKFFNGDSSQEWEYAYVFEVEDHGEIEDLPASGN